LNLSAVHLSLPDATPKPTNKTENNLMGHQHTHACTCGCNNPIVNTLLHDIFSDEHIAKMTAGLSAGQASKATAEAVLITGGTIRPMTAGKATTVEAIGFAEGKVVAAGTLAAVQTAMDKSYKGYKKRTLTGGQTLLPGLFEPHIHTIFSGMMAEWVDVSPFDGQDMRKGYNKDWVKSALKAAVSKRGGKAVLATGLDPALILPQSGDTFSQINNLFLDEVSKTTPILVMSASGHTIYANTPALYQVYACPKNADYMKAHNYTSETVYADQTHGLLEEEVNMQPAINGFYDAIMETTLPIVKNMKAFFKDANARGVTSMYDALINEMYQKLLDVLFKTVAEPSVRLGGALYCETMDAVNNLKPYQQPETYSVMYHGHVKIVSDGSNQGLTGYQSKPYSCHLEGEPDCGIFNFTTGTYQQMVKTVIGKGWPLMIHANGDRAITETIAAYKAALSAYNGLPLRNRIEHCSLLDKNSIREMNALNLSPSFLIGHVGYWGDVFGKVIFANQTLDGKPKVDLLDPCKSALEGNLRISLHSDHTVTPVGPLRMMEQSITRVMEAPTADPSDNILNKAERLTPEEALRAVTYDAAWQCYADRWAGSLTEGYFADYIILAQDPVTMPADQISMNMRNIKVEETWLGGVQVYAAKA